MVFDLVSRINHQWCVIRNSISYFCAGTTPLYTANGNDPVTLEDRGTAAGLVVAQCRPIVCNA